MKPHILLARQQTSSAAIGTNIGHQESGKNPAIHGFSAVKAGEMGMHSGATLGSKGGGTHL